MCSDSEVEMESMEEAKYKKTEIWWLWDPKLGCPIDV